MSLGEVHHIPEPSYDLALDGVATTGVCGSGWETSWLSEVRIGTFQPALATTTNVATASGGTIGTGGTGWQEGWRHGRWNQS